MKKFVSIFSLLLLFIGFSNAISAQNNNFSSSSQVKPGRAMLNVPSLTTEEQFLTLQSSVLNKVEGLALSTWNPSSKQISLMYDLSKTNADKVIELLKQNGYTATLLVATENPHPTSGK